METTSRKWLAAREAAKLLDVPTAAVARLAARGVIRKRRLPVRAVYNAGDVRWLVEQLADDTSVRRARECWTKLAYPSEAIADRARLRHLDTMPGSHDARLRPYKCSSCPAWHLGHSTVTSSHRSAS